MLFVSQSFDPKGTLKDRIAKYETYVNKALKLPFFNELSQVPGIQQLCLGIMSKETHFVPWFMSYWSPAYIVKGFAQAKTSKKIYEMMGGTQDTLANAYLDPLNFSRPQKYFVLEVITPHGLGQVMGYHFCQDLSISVMNKKGKGVQANTFIKGFGIVPRADGGSFACSYLSPPGTINNMFANQVYGEENQVIASMIVLNDKYQGFKKSTSGKVEAINLAVKGYLGSGEDSNHTSPEVYLADVRNFDRNSAKGGTTGSIQLAANKNAQTADIKKACTVA